MPVRDKQTDADAPPARGAGWFLFLGLVLIGCGTVAILLSTLSDIPAATVLGTVLVIAGIAEIVQSLRAGYHRRSGWQIGLGLIGVIGGLMLHVRPFTGMIGVSFLFALIFVAQGIALVMMSKERHAEAGSGWLLAAGLISVAASCVLVLKLPFVSLRAPGAMAGAVVVVAGAAYVAIAAAVRRAGSSN